VTARGFTVLRTTTTAWTTPGAATTQVVSIVESTPDGSRTWQTVNGLTTQTVRSYGANATRTETTTAPDGTISTRQFQNDRLISNAVSHPALGQLAATTLSYDTHGRLQTSTDARAGATTYTYFADDQPQTITSPDPDPTRTGPGYDPQVTRYAYDAAGRVNLVTQPDGATVSTLYYFSGQIKQVSGSRTYPVEYAYDTRGQLQTLKTWTNFAAGIFGDSVTTFNYDQKRGWLASKEAPGAANTFYTYYPSGRIKTRSSNRANAPKATHVYNTAGDLSGITYSESTPAVAFTYDRLGRPLTTTDASGTCTWSYHVSGQRQNETYGTTGLLANLGLTRSFDSLDRLSGVAAFSLGSRLSALGYSYDPSSRLQTLTVGPNVATYAYLPNSSLVSTITVSNSGAVRLTTAKTYDNLNRLASTVSTPSTSPIVSSAYTYNAANQRTKTTLADGQSWNYAYDALGQVTSAKKTLATGATLGGHDFAYTYDDLGNRKTTTTNGQSSVYTNAAPSPSDSWASVPNVYAERTVPGVVDVTGTANPAASVVVNQADAQRQGDAFYRAVPVDNTAAPVYLPVEIVGVRNNAGPAGEDAVTTQTRSAFVPQARELYTHDHNLTADGRWLYTWDAENRLTAMETQTAAVTAGVPKQKLEFSYDAQSRRVAKKVSNWSGTAYTVAIETRFIYDGWNLLAEVNALAANTPIRTYVWGLDLSGSTQGAGGVGGLLAVNSGTSTYAAAYDGNGNVSALVNAADGTLAARYDYNAFGERVLTDGPAALLNPFRFSTKYEDPESGLLYYGFRYYNPSTGRWPSRDPIEEQGGVNLYGFVGNDPVGSVDVLGLAGYFFDGTGNSPKSGTNVLILHDAYDGLAFYYRGVGSSFGTRAVGGLTGAGGSNRLEDAYRDFIRAIDSGDRYVDIVGFSRGAALAREFANLLNERGYDPSYGGKLKHKLRAGTNKPPGECEFVIRFVGLFDTVGSFGVPGNDTNIGIRMDLPGTVGNAAQATAQNERRFLFPLTPLGDREGFDEQGFPGDHSDIGRGHGKGTNDLSRAPLEYMWNQGRAAGAPFGSLPQYTPTGNTTPHDLSRKFPHNLFPKRTR
jgi:RHS repeat-associated protein